MGGPRAYLPVSRWHLMRVMVGHFPLDEAPLDPLEPAILPAPPGFEIACWPRHRRYWPPPGGSDRPDSAPLAQGLEKIGWSRADLYLQWGAEYRPLPPDSTNPSVCSALALQIGDWNVSGRLVHWLRTAPEVPVLCDEPGAPRLKALGLRHVGTHIPWGWHPGPWPAVGTEPRTRDIDLLFVGSRNEAIHLQRERILERVAELTELRVVLTTWVTPEVHRELALRSRMVLNHSVRGEINLRTFEAIASGCVLLNEASNTSLSAALSPGLEYVPYEPDTLVETVRALAADPVRQERIRRRASARLPEFASTTLLQKTIADYGDWLAAAGTLPQTGAQELDLERQWLLTCDQGCLPPALYRGELTGLQAGLLEGAEPPSLPNSTPEGTLVAQLTDAELAVRVGDDSRAVESSSAALALLAADAPLSGADLMPPDFSWWRLDLERALLDDKTDRVREWVRARCAWILVAHQTTGVNTLLDLIGVDCSVEVPELRLAIAAELLIAGRLCERRFMLHAAFRLSPRHPVASRLLVADASGRHDERCGCEVLDPAAILARHGAARAGLQGFVHPEHQT